ncbi:phage integrase SAM-like domain-containing protein [Zobellia russellii]|uniref:phage integrase SAM-like domain-containing protein n=1 Tax=Zobellia russellii TaxID=248907 RepID=UPI001BFF0227|nr:phage integrase SAM-like domain-containing protein [Zobellia russellii]MBT9190091.1 phage integrase SAM-like domain-containing protein [Zobellia russellii]
MVEKDLPKKDGTIPIYARIWINSKAIDLSTKESIVEKHWCDKACRAKIRTHNAKYINGILDNLNTGIKRSYIELKEEGVMITAFAIKQRYLGKDKAVLTCMDLIRYHKENEFKKLAPGTIKNYSATEKYICQFIKKQFRSHDVYLAQIDYSFIVQFEHYLRTCPPLRKSRPLNNNGIMKHMERLQKFMTVAFKHGWVKAHPFALYELKFEEFDCPYLEQFELVALATIHLPNKSMCLVRDVFVFSCYTGLCYIEVKNLNKKDIVHGIDEEEWIMVRRQKSNTPVKLPLLDEAKAIEQEIGIDINRATIYRVLNRFCEDGVLHRVVAEDGKQYFALCLKCDENEKPLYHFHFRCMKCETIECLPVEVNFTIPEKYFVENVNCVLTGTCQECH